jgi:hypothetical protein
MGNDREKNNSEELELANKTLGIRKSVMGKKNNQIVHRKVKS